MILISEYGNEVVETNDVNKICRLKEIGFREFNDISNAPKKPDAPKKKVVAKNGK